MQKSIKCINYAIFLIVILYSTSTLLPAESTKLFQITGVVTDSATGQPLRSVTVRLVGTKKGAFSNHLGYYVINVEPGSYMLKFSMIGMKELERSATIVDSNIVMNISLSTTEFETPDVFVYAEDPGIRLMRQVLDKKKKQIDSLQSYSYTLYTKFAASTDTLTAGRSDAEGDTTIISIFESYSKGYYQKPDLYYNEIFQRRQSVNVPPQANFVAFGTNINAYDDFLTFVGEDVFTPFHPSAIDFYDFSILKKYSDSEYGRIVIINVKPLTNQRKLFTGKIYISEETLSPIWVELTPNAAVQLPLGAELNFEQKFIIDSGFCLPASLKIFASVGADLFWVLSPRLDIRIENVAYDYQINTLINSDVFSGKRVDVNEDAEKFDTTYWKSNEVLPLSNDEKKAYDNIRMVRENPDSVLGTNLFRTIFGPIQDEVAKFNRRPFTGIEDLFIYNRIHGPYLGIGVREFVTPTSEINLKSGYGISDDKFYYNFGLRQFLTEGRTIGFSGYFYDELARRDDPFTVKYPAITTLSLLSKNDYGDYYYRKGFKASVNIGFGQLFFIRREIFEKPTGFDISYIQEEHQSANRNSNFAFFGWDRQFRDNPKIENGTLRSLLFDFYYQFNDWRRISDFGFKINTEYSSDNILKSDFGFTQISGKLFARLPSLLPLWNLDIRFSAGYSPKGAPPQRYFSLDSRYSGTASAGAFRGMNVKEFYGDNFFALNMEHNFGELIPGIFRIPNIASFGLEFIGMASIGWTEFSDESKSMAIKNNWVHLASTNITGDKYYYEVGLAINRLLIFFRTDFTLRLSQNSYPSLIFSITTATN